MTQEKVVYRIREFSAVTGLSRAKIYDLLKTGHLRASKLGKTTLIPADEVNAFLDGLKPYQSKTATQR